MKCIGKLITFSLFILVCAGNNYIPTKFSGLNYNTDEIHRQLHPPRSKRSVKNIQNVEFSFEAPEYNRKFHLVLKRDLSLFSPDMKITTSNASWTLNDIKDELYTYHGYIKGERGRSDVYGYFKDDIFQGRIVHNESFFVQHYKSIFGKHSDRYHSIIYDENKEIVEQNYSKTGCAFFGETEQKMKAFTSKYNYNPTVLSGFSHFGEAPFEKYTRDRRSTTPRHVPDKNTCQLHIRTDDTFTAMFNGNKQEVVNNLYQYVKTLNNIFNPIVFQTSPKSISGLGFVIGGIKIDSEAELSDPAYPYKERHVGVENLLDFLSHDDHSQWCLSYLFTRREFQNGVLGLAWVAETGKSGGICDVRQEYPSGRDKSLNTGLITVLNYDKTVLPIISHITFAHEVGHNWGSPHDFPPNCQPGGKDGNFIMFSSATSANRKNNDKFSPCSIANMTAVLTERREKCFTKTSFKICGNKVVEGTEECDCGYSSDCDDKCCFPADSEIGEPCTLVGDFECSPTAGPCCNRNCEFKANLEPWFICRNSTECAEESRCTQFSAVCPSSTSRPNTTKCNNNTQVCNNGQCAGSLCSLKGLEDCSCEEEPHYCHLCCRSSTQPNSCQLFLDQNNKSIQLNIGAPCRNLIGYCNVFDMCMEVNSAGPLLRLKEQLFNSKVYITIYQWGKDHWWATLLIVLFAIILMGGFIKLFSVHTPSSNPYMPKNRNIRQTMDTVYTLPRTIRRSTRGHSYHQGPRGPMVRNQNSDFRQHPIGRGRPPAHPMRPMGPGRGGKKPMHPPPPYSSQPPPYT